jgi:NAD(P)-dependent dehydrogenase (short-subunit alcohol dehydrogenase family)
MTNVSGKILIITGGTQGIGEETALMAADSGAAGIVICGRQRDKGNAVAEAIQAKGCDAEFVPADLSDPEACRNVVRRCDQRFGRVDGLLNSAGDTSRGTLDETTVELWDRIFAINVRAPFILTQEVARIMKREKTAGSICNVLSVNAACGYSILCAYSASKGALYTLTKNNAHDLRKSRIRVNGINLGWTDTPAEHEVQIRQGAPENWLELAEAESPFGRLIKAPEVARLCLYFLSDESGIVTGSCMDYSQRVMGIFPPENA